MGAFKLKETKRVVIVGAGIIGLCVADSLLDKGFEVVVLDENSTNGDGCSFGNGGIVTPSHFVPLANPQAIRAGLPMLIDPSSPFGVGRWTSLATLEFLSKFIRASTEARVLKAAPLLRDLNLASRDGFEQLISKLGIPLGYARRGLLMLCNTAKGLDGESHLAEDAGRLGLKVSVLNRAGVEALEPNVHMATVGGVHFHDDAHLTPSQTMRALRTRVESRGGEIRFGTATGFRHRNGSIESVRLADDEILSDEVVLAAGAWSRNLAQTLGIKLPLLAGKGFGFTVSSPPELPCHPAILVEARIAVTPMLDGLRFVGTLELGEADRATDNFKSKRLAGMKSRIPDYYPSFSPSDLDAPAWSGLRPCSPDGLPYIGRTERFENLIIATGHAMMGMSLGPVTGRLVRELICREPSFIDIALLSPNRYA